MSARMRTVGWWLRLQRGAGEVRRPLRTYEQRARSRTYPQPARLPTTLRRLCEVRQCTVLGNQVLTLMPRGPENVRSARPRQVIYTHGGAYTDALARQHWHFLAELVRRTGVTVTVPLYRLAPEGTFRHAYPFLTAVYQELLERVPSDDVILAGDSAGGGLAVGQALHYRELQLPSPGRLILISPWLDVTMSNPAIARIAPTDPMLKAGRVRMSGRWWAGDEDLRHPLVSPLYADVGGLPPMDSYVGTREVLLPDMQQFDAKVRQAGGESVVHVTPGGWHVFALVPWLPEGRTALDDMERLLGSRRSG